MGQEIFVIGSTELFGNWQHKSALKMIWSCGNVWRVNLNPDSLKEKVEYKFIVISDQ